MLATSAGNISVVWTSGTTIYAQLLSTTGEPLADSVVVSTSASPHWTVNQIALPNGGIFINWRGADGSGEGAEARVLDAQGQIVSDELIINDVTSGYQYGDQAAVNSAGIVLSTFVADDGSGFGVFAQKLQIGGASTVPINTAPTDISIATPIVPENAPAGTVVGTLTATDANAGDTHTFELTSDPSGFFEIVGNQVRVKSGAAIDYETATSHQIEVKATDFGGLATSKTFVLGISDVPGVAQVGGAGNDYLVGTPENDTLDGGIGADIMDGGEGDDVFIVDDPADIVVAGYSLSLPNNTQLFFAQGYDTVYTSVSYNTSIGIEKVVLTGTAPIDVTGFARIRNPLVVGSLKEHFIGNDAANRLSGVDDDDILEGGGGNDTLIGGEGADKLDGGAGNDTVDYSTAVSGLTVSLAHVDRNTGDAAGDTYVSIERLVGSSYANVLYGNRWTATEIDGGAGDDRVFGFGDSDILLGNVGTDRLYGGHGGDILIGGQDFDILYGEGGDDLLDGVDGETVKVADHLVGGLGDDHYVVDGDTVIEAAGQGYDTVETRSSMTLRAGAEIELVIGTTTAAAKLIGNEFDQDMIDLSGRAAELRGMGGSDYLEGYAGSDWLWGDFAGGSGLGVAGNDELNGGAGNDWLYGEAGDDLLFGGGDNDRLYGGTGDDTGFGDAGDDILYGEAGNDTLNGGVGIDRLVGGQGADTFVYVTGDGNDVIFDFTVADGDKVSLVGVTFVSGALSGTAFAELSNGDVLRAVNGHIWNIDDFI